MPVIGGEMAATVFAVEYKAIHDGHWIDPMKGGDMFLLDRPVVLPTAPYSVVAPPVESAKYEYPFILDRGAHGTIWRETKNGDSAAPEAVEQAVKNGWRIIENKEEVTE